MVTANTTDTAHTLVTAGAIATTPTGPAIVTVDAARTIITISIHGSTLKNLTFVITEIIGPLGQLFHKMRHSP